jgi:Transposase domain (DUF772)
MGVPSLPPGRYFRMHLVGYSEGIDSERGLEWRCADSLSLRDFLGRGAMPAVQRLRGSANLSAIPGLFGTTRRRGRRPDTRQRTSGPRQPDPTRMTPGPAWSPDSPPAR